MRTIKTVITAGLAAATLVGGLAVATESSAQPRRGYYGGRYDGYWRRDHDRGGELAAGIAGLALGAAIAGGSRPYYGGGYYYAPAPAYAYSPGYYYGRPYYGGYYRPSCWRWAHDRWGRPIRVQGWC